MKTVKNSVRAEVDVKIWQKFKKAWAFLKGLPIREGLSQAKFAKRTALSKPIYPAWKMNVELSEEP
jgi:hypothetical protein